MLESMAERYRKMLHELSGYISPDVEDVWNKFINMVKALLKPAEVSKAQNVFDVCNQLQEKEIISYGKYGKLLDIFEFLKHKQCYDIVKRYSSVNNDATNEDRMRNPPEQGIRVDHDTLHCHCDKDKICQLGLIKIATKIKDIELSNPKSIKNTTKVVKQMINDRNIMEESEFKVLIIKKECNSVCVFIETMASINNKMMVERMANLLVPDTFIYDQETSIRKEQGKPFYLEIKSFLNTEDIRPDPWYYKKRMKNLLLGYRNQSGNLRIEIIEITNKSGKQCVQFTIEAENFTMEDLHDCLEKHCGETIFEEISLCQQEHLHATWFPINEECNIKKKLEEQLNKSKDENVIYDFRTSCTQR